MATEADFQTALAFVIGDPYGDPGGEEMGYNPADPSYRGVVQGNYDAYRVAHGYATQDVRNITGDELVDFYRSGYWVPSGAAALAMPLAQVVFDTAVNMGVTQAKTLAADSAGDVNQLLALRAQRYAAIAENNPSKARELGGWLQRLDHLATAIGPVGGVSAAVVVLVGVAFGLWVWGRKQKT